MGCWNYRSMLISFAVCATLFLGACKQKGKSNLFPAGSPMESSIRFEYAVYMMPMHTKDPLAVLRQILAKDSPQLKLVEEIPESPKEMFVQARLETDVARKYAPPDFGRVQEFGHGVSDQQNKTLQKSKEAFILDFSHPSKYVWQGLRNANQVIEEVAREMTGLVWDEETRRVYSPDAWHEATLAKWSETMPQVSDQTQIDIYENGEFVRAVALGMKKFGLPDVVIQETDSSSERTVGNLINTFTQALAEGQTIPKSGKFRLDLNSIHNLAFKESQLKALKQNARGMACVTVKNGVIEEGDAHNRLLQLSFDEYRGGDAHAQLQAAMDGLFGWEDSIQYIEHTDEVSVASNKARAELPRMRTDFRAGLQPGEYILVKSPFAIPGGGREWMWVEVRAWKGNNIEGLLENNPDRVPDLHAGQLVKVREDEVFDYQRHFADGHEEGNFTGKFLRDDKSEKDTSNKTGKPAFVPNCDN